MASSTPEILKALLGKSADLGKLSPDAKKLLDTIQTELQSDVFRHFFGEYEKLNSIGLTPADLRQYFDEWYTDAVSIINDSGVQLFINEQHTKIFGYTAADLVGHDTYGMLFPEEFKPVIKAKSELRRKGVSDVYEARMYRKNRELIDVRITGKPLLNSSGMYIGAIAIIEDITKERELEDRLRRTNEELEAKVQKRTRELTISNYQMVNEIKERKLAEIAVKNSEKRFRDLFYSSPEGVFVEDFEGNIYDLNDAAAKLHGYSREDMIGQNVRQFSPDDDLGAYQMRQEQLTLGTIGSFEARIRHRDGHLIPVAVRTAVIEYNDKPALLLHARDITDRVRYQETLKEMNVQLEKKVRQRTEELENLNSTLHKEVSYRKDAEKAIEQQKDFLRMLIDMNPNLIFVRDNEGRYVLVNEAFAHFNNTTSRDMIGRHIDEFLPDKEQARRFEEEDKVVALRGETIQQTDERMHHRGSDKDIYVQLVKRPIPALDGQSNNILGIITDITEIKAAEEKLKESEQLYRQIARNVPNSAIFIYDKDLRYVLAEGSLIGVISPPKELVEGRTIYDITEKDLIPARESRYKNILLGNSQVEQFEEGDKTLLTNALPIKDDHGNIIYGMVIILDITDLTKAQKELEEKASTLKRSNEELERFAYVASHDLQGPLRTITSYLQLLEQRYFQDLGADAKDFITFSVAGAKRMQQLITDLLNYSRLNSVPRPYQNVNLNELLFVVTKNLESTIESKGATIEYSSLPTIFAEQYQLTQMLQNLVDNAMKFIPTDRKPLIKISCEEDADYWNISVSDNGIGIKEEFKDKVFQIFQRLHTDNEYPGTGIGLAICKKVADLHDGQIWFDSEYGKGTTFHVTISKSLKNKM